MIEIRKGTIMAICEKCGCQEFAGVEQANRDEKPVSEETTAEQAAWDIPLNFEVTPDPDVASNEER